MKCANCRSELQALNPPVEEYLIHKFCINIFDWKLMLLKDNIEFGCVTCITDKKQSDERNNYQDAVNCAITEEIEKGNLVYKR